jgi:carbamoyltransferase
MKVLGLHWTLHDNAAALVIDGEVVASVEEERLSRQKHGPWLYPRRAVEWCLDHAGVRGDALDAVAIDFSPTEGALGAVVETVRHGSWKTLGGEAFRRSWTALAPVVVRRHLGARPRTRFVPHHRAHAATAWFSSGFERAAVLVVDGMGDFSCAAVFDARDGRLRQRWANRFPDSLGLVYAALTAYLGFRPFSDEYKVMGLAAHGRDRFRRELGDIIEVARDGRFAIADGYFTFRSDYSRLPFYGPALERVLGPARRPGEPVDERHADIAASLQARLEEAMLALAAAARRLTGARDLCLAGGVALNCAMNGRLRAAAPFDRTFAGPAPHDAGCAMGAALAVAADAGDRPRPPSPYLGPACTPDTIARVVATSLLPARRLADPAATAAQLVAQGHAVAWLQGRLELGPRALGNRSILADPRDPAMPGFLNRHVKQREEFRPFAPAVLAERAGELFDLAGASPYMQFAVPVRTAWRARIPAVVHVDGTARVQTVAAADNPAFRRVLEEFDRRTGVPCLLNTSLNSHGDPMAASAEDALACFGRTGLRYAILGDWLVAKRESDLASA